MPKISIITTCLNQAPLLEQTICSVLDQGRADVEYLVIDGGSGDGSTEVIRHYADELAWAVREPAANRAELVNRALSRATGEVVGLLEAGDLYLPHALDKVDEMFNGDDPADWVVSDCQLIGPEDEPLGTIWASVPESLLELLKHDSGCFPSAGTFWRRSLSIDAGGLDSSLAYAHLYDLWCRLFAMGHRPRLLWHQLGAHRDTRCRDSAEATLRTGSEFIAAAERRAPALAANDRRDLWRNCDQRRRIYALAEAEVHGQAKGRRFLLDQVLHHPWWVADHAFRRAIVNGVDHPLPPDMARPAA